MWDEKMGVQSSQPHLIRAGHSSVNGHLPFSNVLKSSNESRGVVGHGTIKVNTLLGASLMGVFSGLSQHHQSWGVRAEQAFAADGAIGITTSSEELNGKREKVKINCGLMKKKKRQGMGLKSVKKKLSVNLSKFFKY